MNNNHKLNPSISSSSSSSITRTISSSSSSNHSNSSNDSPRLIQPILPSNLDFFQESLNLNNNNNSNQPSSSSAPRSSITSNSFLEDEGGFTSSNNSDSYDSSGELTGSNVRSLGFSSTSTTDEGGSYYSSRANSPQPPPIAPHSIEHWEGYRPDILSYRTISRNRSRAPSGTTTPTNSGDREKSGTECKLFVCFFIGLSKLSCGQNYTGSYRFDKVDTWEIEITSRDRI